MFHLSRHCLDTFTRLSQVYLRSVLGGKRRFLDDIREAFAYFDSDHSGRLERDELCASLRAVTTH